VSINGKRVLCAVGALSLSLWLAAPASADDDMPPCTLGIICAFVPGASNLDHDVDLTKDQPPVPDQETAPPLNPCINGCI
jgi:hypothetical protein